MFPGKPKAPPPHQQTQPSGVHVHVQKRALKQIQDDESGVVTDVFSGLRLKNALVSPALMKERMAGRQMVRLSRVVESNLASLKDKDWVTIGVLVDKLPPKETSKGDKFAVWKLSDLSSSSSILVFFLFKDVYQKHWKTPQGQVVALLNPDKMQSKEGHDNVAITIDHPHKMMILGTSKDLAVCSGKNSKTGRSCRNYINKSQGDYCEFHVQAAYKKARACRMECQKGYGPSAKLNRNQKSLSTDGFFYAGQSYTLRASSGKSEAQEGGKRDRQLCASSMPGVTELMAEENSQRTANCGTFRATGATTIAKGSETFRQLLQSQTIGARNFNKFLKSQMEKACPPAKRHKSMTKLLNEHKMKQPQAQSANHKLIQLKDNPDWLQPKPKQSKTEPQNATGRKPEVDSESDDEFSYGKDDDVRPKPGKIIKPVIGRGFEGDSIVFNIGKLESTRRPTKVRTAKEAKKKAIEMVRKKGMIKADDPNAVGQRKKTNEEVDEIRKRVNSETKNDPQQSDAYQVSVGNGLTKTSQASKNRLSLADFNIDINSDEGKQLVQAKSQHEELVVAAEQEKEDEYFRHLEQREKMEDKMRATMEIRVRVVSCLECHYIAENAAKRCLDECHKTVKHKAMKRFFVCKKCKQRTHTYDEKYPIQPCK
jgi:minichromosome maintenance protein 10